MVQLIELFRTYVKWKIRSHPSIWEGSKMKCIIAPHPCGVSKGESRERFGQRGAGNRIAFEEHGITDNKPQINTDERRLIATLIENQIKNGI